jgi:uncharacterized phage protein gp47/JayE
MPFRRPTLPELIERTDAEVESRLAAGPLLRRSVLGVISRVMAGAVHLMFGFLDWAARQLLPDTCEGAELDRWSSIKGITRKPAVAAEGVIELVGVNGSVAPIDTELRRSDGELYRTTTAATIVDGVALASVEAVTPGIRGMAPAGTKLSIRQPVAGYQAVATVIDPGIVDGADEESDEDLRARLLFALSHPPHGGSESDYVMWALEVPSVTRAWAFKAHLGLGTVGVTFVVDDDPNGPIPSPAKVDEVREYIEDGRRPVTADVFVFAPVAYPVDMVIQLIPDSPTIREEVLESLLDLFNREGEPGKNMPISKIREAVSTSPGEDDNAVLAPDSDVVVAPGNLPRLGNVAWA